MENTEAFKLGICGSVTYQDYKERDYIPDIDKLLDWRIRLCQLIQETTFDHYLYEKEIRAVDYLLTLKQCKNKY